MSKILEEREQKLEIRKIPHSEISAHKLDPPSDGQGLDFRD